MENEIAKILMCRFSDTIIIFEKYKYEERCIEVARDIVKLCNKQNISKAEGVSLPSHKDLENEDRKSN